MAGIMKNAMSFFGMSDVVDEDDEYFENDSTKEETTSFDDEKPVTPLPTKSVAPSTTESQSSARKQSNPFQGRMSRITTIHPTRYEDAQQVGRALRDGVPVVLNLSGVSDKEAFRIIDFSSGVVFGIYGSIEQVDKRVFLLTPAQVNIVAEQDERDSIGLQLN